MTNRLEQLKSYIQSQGWRWQAGKSIPHGEQIVIHSGAQRATVNFYPRRSKMVVGGAESPLKAALLAWSSGGEQAGLPAAKSPASSAPAAPAAPDAPDLHQPHIGMDESGKGDWFGPLVVAAVHADEQALDALRQVGVQDSKALSGAAISRIAGEIKRLVPPDRRHVLVLLPADYNRLYARHQNLNLLLADVYAQAAETVWQATREPVIVCDQFARRKDHLERTFAARGLPLPWQQHRAEAASLAAAAASILATAAFVAALEELGAAAGIGGALPKGASDVALLERAARHIIRRHGPAALGGYAKLHFKPIQALLSQ